MTARILLIDDEPDVTEIFGSLLKAHQFHVTQCDDPKVAIEKITNEQFDVVITDIMMPHIDGFQVINHLRSQGKTKHTPVIALTAKVLNDEERKVLLQHDAHVQIKPIAPNDLVDLVKSLI